MQNQTRKNRTGKSRSSTTLDDLIGKLPPQAVEVEKQILGMCLQYENYREYVSFLLPEHFYLSAHQGIWNAIWKVKSVSLSSVKEQLKSTGELEQIGGISYLVNLTGYYLNPHSLEYYGRIIQQQFVKREVIRISNQNIKLAYDDQIDCIELFDNFTEQVQQVETIFNPELSSKSLISDREHETEYIKQALSDTLPMGLSTGFEEFDNYFRFKPESFVIVNGHDNVGKTAVLVYMAVISNLLHGWRWMFACMENQEAEIRLNTIQFITGKHVKNLSKDEFDYWYDWSHKNFTIFVITQQMTATRLMTAAEKINRKNPHQAFLIDPYNALDIDIENSKLSSHEYHYRITGMMRNFIRRNKCSIYLNTHAISEALRQKHKDGDYAGFAMPPEKADTEGGGKFANRADDFLTIHRYVQHPDEHNVTHIHVRKIKVTQTGGRPTVREAPFKLQMMKGRYGFFDMAGYSPVFKNEKTKPAQTSPPVNFYEKEEPDEPPF